MVTAWLDMDGAKFLSVFTSGGVTKPVVSTVVKIKAQSYKFFADGMDKNRAGPVPGSCAGKLLPQELRSEPGCLKPAMLGRSRSEPEVVVVTDPGTCGSEPEEAFFMK